MIISHVAFPVFHYAAVLELFVLTCKKEDGSWWFLTPLLSQTIIYELFGYFSFYCNEINKKLFHQGVITPMNWLSDQQDRKGVTVCLTKVRLLLGLTMNFLYLDEQLLNMTCPWWSFTIICFFFQCKLSQDIYGVLLAMYKKISHYYQHKRLVLILMIYS